MRRSLGAVSSIALRPHTLRRTALQSTYQFIRSNASVAASNPSGDVVKEEPPAKGSFFVDRIFPIRISYWDIRPWIASFREQAIVDSLRHRLQTIDVPGFKVLDVDHSGYIGDSAKDGGVFVEFEYRPLSSKPEDKTSALLRVQDAVRKKAEEKGGLPSWFGPGRATVWTVKGSPWAEDLQRYASANLKVEFEGPDVHPETLFKTFRPFGRIEEITRPTPVPAGSLRSSLVEFERVTSAARAQNCLHGLVLSNNGANTRLSILYEPRLKGHVVQDWLSSHPRIVLPVLAFLFGTLTYTIFDPVRAWMVQAKVENWFDYKDYAIVQWLRRNTIDKMSIDFSSAKNAKRSTITWDERKEAEATIEKYLNDVPTTVAFLHGPAGSGKSSLVNRLLSESKRPYIEIDCAKLSGASSDAQVIRQLAGQTGYFPVFSGLAWVNSMIDLASVGLIGQKAGFSKTIEEQLKDVLDVVGSALKHVNSSHMERVAKAGQKVEAAEARRAELSSAESGEPQDVEAPKVELPSTDLSGLPIVILKNFNLKGASKREGLLDVLADWSAALIDNQIAHVIVSSNNRESMKRVARATGSKPLVSVAFADADTQSALSIVSARMEEAQIQAELSPSEVEKIKLLGGRSSDLDALVFKVRSGLSIEDGVEDIIARTLSELRKNAFGDDNEDAKRLAWKPEQAWVVIRGLAARSELPYSETLLDFPFKGDDSALREMEKAELISIVTDDGFPVTIRPGRPVYHHVFERLAQDKLFSAVQEIGVNAKLIESAEATVKSCESELLTLRSIGLEQGKSFWHGAGATGLRAEALLRKMEEAVGKVEKLERTNAGLKKRLAARKTGERGKE